jgi:hypothetical protein
LNKIEGLLKRILLAKKQGDFTKKRKEKNAIPHEGNL